MPQITIGMLDATYEPSLDYVNARPTVYVDLSIDGQPIMNNERALVDTGASKTMFHPDFLFGQQAKGAASIDTAEGRLFGSRIFDAVLEIVGLDDPLKIEVGTRPGIPYAVLLGRDVLAHYTMVYDPPNRTFTLSTP
jgi:hypothetical protein